MNSWIQHYYNSNSICHSHILWIHHYNNFCSYNRIQYLYKRAIYNVQSPKGLCVLCFVNVHRAPISIGVAKDLRLQRCAWADLEKMASLNGATTKYLEVSAGEIQSCRFYFCTSSSSSSSSSSSPIGYLLYGEVGKLRSALAQLALNLQPGSLAEFLGNFRGEVLGVFSTTRSATENDTTSTRWAEAFAGSPNFQQQLSLCMASLHCSEASLQSALDVDWGGGRMDLTSVPSRSAVLPKLHVSCAERTLPKMVKEVTSRWDGEDGSIPELDSWISHLGSGKTLQPITKTHKDPQRPMVVPALKDRVQAWIIVHLTFYVAIMAIMLVL